MLADTGFPRGVRRAGHRRIFKSVLDSPGTGIYSYQMCQVTDRSLGTVVENSAKRNSGGFFDAKI